MEKEKFEKLIELGLSQRAIGENLKTSQANVKYWLNKFGLKTNLSQYNVKNGSLKKCLVCDKTCEKNLCSTCNTNIRRCRVKQLAVEHLGGKCERCGWAGDLSGFDFHHKDPSEKDFNPSAVHLANMSWEKAKKEINKCELLCAICHRKEHSNYDDFKELVLKYKGKTFK